MHEASPLNRNVRVLWGGQFLSIAGLTVTVPLLPFYLRELGALGVDENRMWTGLCLAAPAVTLALVSPIWGKLGDRWGRKWMVVRALSGLAASLALMGLAQTPAQFFLFRLLQGACGGIVDSASAFAGAEAPEEERGKVLGLLQSATAAGALAGPLFGGVAADAFGLRPLLLVAAVMTGASGLIAALVLKESEGTDAAKGRSVRRSFREVLARPRTRAFVIAGVLAQVGVYGLITVFAPHVEGLLAGDGYAATWVGALQAVAWGAGMLGAPWWGRRNDRSKVEKNFFWASLGCGLGIALLAVPEHVAWLIPLRVLQGFCFGALLQSVFLAVVEEAEGGEEGARVGAANSFLIAGQVVGALLGGVLGGYLTTGWVIVAMGGAFVLGAAWMIPASLRQARTRHRIWNT